MLDWSLEGGSWNLGQAQKWRSWISGWAGEWLCWSMAVLWSGDRGTDAVFGSDGLEHRFAQEWQAVLDSGLGLAWRSWSMAGLGSCGLRALLGLGVAV